MARRLCIKKNLLHFGASISPLFVVYGQGSLSGQCSNKRLIDNKKTCLLAGEKIKILLDTKDIAWV